jgi:signal transduction histidine kinase
MPAAAAAERPGSPRGLPRAATAAAVEPSLTPIQPDSSPALVAPARDIRRRRRIDSDQRASRLRIVAAGDAARRRIERDLHDGAQQRLVALALRLRLARARADDDPTEVPRLLDEAIEELAAATAELRELARGIHPVVLTEGGLEPALRGLAARSALPVTIAAAPRARFPAHVEATAYFVVAEALTNAIRHARATGAEIRVARRGATLAFQVADDGCGGAALARGSGLRGLAARVAALGGSFAVDSPAGGGTTVRVELPCGS